MRTLEKNKRSTFYALPTDDREKIYDEDGHFTGEYATVYGELTKLMVNYSAGTGEETLGAFGTFTDYSKVLVICGACPLIEGAKMIIEDKVYRVMKIAKSLNSTLIAIQEV